MRSAAVRLDNGKDALFAQIGSFLAAQGLDPSPAHYSFAHAALTDPAIGSAVARLTDDGVRLSRGDIEQLGGSVVPRRTQRTVATPPDDQTMRLVAETQAQVDGFADLMRSIRQETSGFGRDLQESAAAIGRQPQIAGIDEIARITGAMVTRIRDAEVRLARATAETDTLRAKLGEAQAQARRDPLTGLANRLSFEEAFAAPVDATAPRCLAIADVDHFKRFNDEHGHGVGDRVLSAIGRGLEQACTGQLVARYGGEEFAVLMGGVPLTDATTMLNDAREALAARQFRDRATGAALRRITLSAGVVSVRPGETLGAALARADELLYAAKADGRDRVIAG
ncbi:diguanylate cyclase [Sphingomonas sp.]|uniref:GGDEF domain-containing protein n=1 Tax=Sphingomonas sp. TaxID=28214 RepID=UPI003CC50803